MNRSKVDKTTAFGNNSIEVFFRLARFKGMSKTFNEPNQHRPQSASATITVLKDGYRISAELLQKPKRNLDKSRINPKIKDLSLLVCLNQGRFLREI